MQAKHWLTCGTASLFCLLILWWTPKQAAGDEQYVIDTLVIVDSQAFNPWILREPSSLSTSQRKQAAEEKVKKYTSLVIRQANLRLESLTDASITWTIRLSVSKFVINSNLLSASVNRATGAVNGETALQMTRIWLTTNGYQDLYDYVILFTGHDIVGSSNQPYEVKGIANIGTLCEKDGTSLAVVEDRGGFQSVHFVAHEFGHSLGSKHDGVVPNTACPDGDRYLMAINISEVTPSNILNPWYFSSCSKLSIGTYMADTILKKHAPCLRDGQTPDPAFSATDDMLAGQEYDANQQCQNMYGDKSSLCLGGNFGERSDICTSMFCKDTSPGSLNFQCLEAKAAEGTSCGAGKLCNLGRCVDSPRAPAVIPDICIDSDSVSINGQFTCSQFTAISKNSCYGEEYNATCCESCKKAKVDSQACPYGDKKNDCGPNLCQLINPDGTRYEEICCGTCNYDVSTPCVDTASVDGMTCNELVKKNEFQGCYNSTVAYHCCKTCEGVRRQVQGCEYGDKDLTCGGYATTDAACQQYGSICCHTCSNRNNNDRNQSARLQTSMATVCTWVAFVLMSTAIMGT